MNLPDFSDPDWRRHMSFGWRASRWWSLNWTIVAGFAATAVLAVAAGGAVWWWLS